MSKKNTSRAAESAPVNTNGRFARVTKDFEETTWVSMEAGNVLTGVLVGTFETQFGAAYNVRVTEGNPACNDPASDDKGATINVGPGSLVSIIPPTSARQALALVAGKLNDKENVVIQVTFGEMTKNPKSGRLYRKCEVGYYSEAK